jgi:hypothetical protein
VPFTICVAIGAVVVGTPVGAHVGGSINHLWGHLQPKADARYYTKSSSNARYYTKRQVDDRYYTKDEVNDRYYTKDEANDRYYTKDESNDRYYTKDQSNDRYVNENELLWAVVNADGSLARGSGVQSIQGSGTGNYRIYFTRDVTNCAYIATIGRSDIFAGPQPGFIGVAGNNVPGLGGEPREHGVLVTTDDTAGQNADRPFHVSVHCQDVASPAREVGPRGGRRGQGTRR